MDRSGLYYTGKFRDDLHCIAKLTDSQEDWRNFRAQRNIVNNLNKSKKIFYYNFKLNIFSKYEYVGGDSKFITNKKIWKNIENQIN